MTNIAIDSIIKQFGKGAIIDADVVLERPQKIISLSPALDIILSGGIPMGVVTTFSGKPKSGKSTLALSFASNFQAANPDSLIYYFDVENRIKPMNIVGTYGLDRKRFKVIGPIPATDKTPAKVYSAEDYLLMARTLIHHERNILIIFDSASAMCSEKELDTDPSGQIRSIMPKLFSHFMKQNAGVVKLNSNIFLSIHHLITNTSGYGETFVEDGGMKIQYWLDVALRAAKKAPWGEAKSPFGQITTWKVKCAALGPPGQEIESYLRFGHGIDREQEIIDLSVAAGLIEKKGSWYVIGEEKYQGTEKLNKVLKDNLELMNQLETSIKELFLPGQ